MPLTPEELAEIQTEAAAGRVHALVAPLSTLGLTFRTAADETTYKNTIEADAVRRRDTALYTEFEAAIEAETGIKKNSGEKATEYLKRATTGIKTELQELRDKKDDGTASTKEKARIVELEKLMGEKDAALTTKETEYKTQLQGYKVDANVDNATALVTAKLKKDLTGDTREDIITARLAKFRKDYTPELEGEGKDEVVVWKKSDGSYANGTNGKRLTTEQILTGVFDAYLDKGKTQTGTGTAPDGKKPETKEPTTVDAYTPGEGVDTKDKLIQDLKSNGFLKGSKEFTELFKKHGEGLKLK